MRFLGIIRSTEFSPNSNDITIINKVGEKFKQYDYEVELMTESDFILQNPNVDAYFSMARSEKALSLLEQKEKEGCWVVNSAVGVRNCSRPIITELMIQNHVGIPKSKIVDLRQESYKPHELSFPCWLKRGDSCAQQKADVSFICNEDEYENAVSDFLSRHIYLAVVSEHVKGDVVKFYGVGETPFFYWYYPTLVQSHSKFGLEEINGPASQYPFDAEALKRETDRIAMISKTPIYGGDCIVGEDGQPKIIDFNDWPSFSCCTDKASSAIAEYFLNKITEHENRRKQR